MEVSKVDGNMYFTILKTMPHNMLKIKIVMPECFENSLENNKTFLRAMRELISAGNLRVSIDGVPIAKATKVEFVYCDTDGWFVFVKESTLYEQLKYAIDWYVTPIGMIEDGRYKTFTGFNLHVIEEDS